MAVVHQRGTIKRKKHGNSKLVSDKKSQMASAKFIHFPLRFDTKPFNDVL